MNQKALRNFAIWARKFMLDAVKAGKLDNKIDLSGRASVA